MVQNYSKPEFSPSEKSIDIIKHIAYSYRMFKVNGKVNYGIVAEA